MLGVADVGLLGPRSVVHDAVADVYLVASVNGPLTADDDNGFVSRVTPDGTVESLTWIAPATPASALSAPTGMALRGDSLFVADIQCIGIFNRVTGEAVERRCLEDSSLLTGLDFGPEGSLFVTDSGYEAGAGGLVSSGTAAVYRLVVEDARRGGTLAQGEDLGHPMSVAVGSRGIFVVTADPDAVTASTRQEFTRRPSSSTVQAPHWPWSQPFLEPVRPRWSRSRSSRDVRWSSSLDRSTPLTIRRTVLRVGLETSVTARS